MQKTDDNQIQRVKKPRHSISTRSFRSIMILVGSISLAAMAIGFFLYADESIRQYRIRTWQIAKTVSAVLNVDRMKDEINEVLETYSKVSGSIDDMPVEQYLDQFSFIEDDGYWMLIQFFNELMKDNDAVAIYLGAVDTKENRIIYIFDSHESAGDKSLEVYVPGDWYELKKGQINGLMNGTQYSILDSLYDQGPIPVILNKDDQHNYRCIAGLNLKNIDGYPIMAFVETDMNTAVKVSTTFLILNFLLLMIITIAAGLLMNHWTRIRVVNPINKLAKAANAYAKSKRESSEHHYYFRELDIHTDDEIENLSSTMESMEKNLTEYEADLTRVTAEKERINTELDVAARIQEGMLPHDFENINTDPYFDLYASMVPAKEVGGDFYDYFMVDDTHIALVMADVSGKGIPAALFMMHSMTLIRTSVAAGDTPGEALTTVNHQLTEGNEADMFVTVWLAVIDLTTGKGIAANAGHEHPALKRSGDQYELIRYRHSPVIGVLDGLSIQEHEFQLQPGDSLFVYTDGITEATSRSKELFGEKRLLEALNFEADASPKRILENVSGHISRFVNKEEQFDDITMLCFHYTSKEPSNDGINENIAVVKPIE